MFLIHCFPIKVRTNLLQSVIDFVVPKHTLISHKLLSKAQLLAGSSSSIIYGSSKDSVIMKRETFSCFLDGKGRSQCTQQQDYYKNMLAISN